MTLFALFLSPHTQCSLLILPVWKRAIHLLPRATNLCLVATKSRDWLNIELKNRKKMKKCIKILHTAWKKAVCEQKRIFTFSFAHSKLSSLCSRQKVFYCSVFFFATRALIASFGIMCVQYWKHMCTELNIILMPFSWFFAAQVHVQK